MEKCTKCGLEIMYNEANLLWETDDAIFCILGPSPFKHMPPWSARIEPKPEVIIQAVYTDEERLAMGYGFFI